MLNDESRKLMKSSKSAYDIQYHLDGRYTADLADPEDCVGFDESYIVDLFKKNGMKVMIHPGSWCGRDNFTSFQDIVLATK